MTPLDRFLLSSIKGRRRCILYLTHHDLSNISQEFINECAMRTIKIKLIDNYDGRRYTVVSI